MKKYLTTTLALLGLAGSAYAAFPLPLQTTLLTSIAASETGGFWVQVDNDIQYRGTRALHGATPFPEVKARGTIIGNASGPDGYWVITNGGTIHALGNAKRFAENLAMVSDYPVWSPSHKIIVSGGATPTGLGLWALGRDGKVYAVGDAVHYGDASKDPQVATGFAATPTGKGYYIVKEDGGVFSFGDAVFFGSTGGKRPGGHHLTGIALHRNGNNEVDGYWLLGADGAIYTFGSAPFLGNGGIDPLERRATSLVSFPIAGPTQGYAWVREDGTLSFVTKPVVL
jgi:hypothetical protein